MTILSSRINENDGMNGILVDIIQSFVEDGIISATEHASINETTNIGTLIDHLSLAAVDARITFLDMSETLTLSKVLLQSRNARIDHLEEILLLSTKALTEVCKAPEFDASLDQATNVFIDNLLNMGPFSLGFNDTIEIDDTASFTIQNVKDLLRSSIAAWLEEKQNNVIKI